MTPTLVVWPYFSIQITNVPTCLQLTTVGRIIALFFVPLQYNSINKHVPSFTFIKRETDVYTQHASHSYIPD